MTATDDFDWRSDDAIVCRWQPATAVYQNTAGSIVVRQERGELDDDDLVLIITPENGELLAAAIAKLARQMLAASPGDGEQAPRQLTFQPPANARGKPPRQIDAFSSNSASAA